jgi:aminopeptidase-like protein
LRLLWCRMIRQITEKMLDCISISNVEQCARKIHSIERTFCYKDFHKSAAFCARQLKKAGAKNIAQISVPSDGKTRYMDIVMPQAWDVRSAELRIIKPKIKGLDYLATHKKEPNCISMWSSPTPKGGVTAELISYESMMAGADVEGKIVFTDKLEPQAVRKDVETRGAIGVVSSWSLAADELPDGISWINGWGRGPGWYQTKEERNMFCFSITPRRGKILRKMLDEGKRVLLKAKVDSSIYDGFIDTVTGVIKGKSQKEIVLIAHIYEPQPNDNATGAAAIIEICRVLSDLIKKGVLARPEFSIRFLIGMELYGMSAYFSNPRNRRNVIATVNMDAISIDHIRSNIGMTLQLNPACTPHCGDALFKSIIEGLFKQWNKLYPIFSTTIVFSDDCFLADPIFGIPTNWSWAPEGIYSHNSANTFKEVDWHATRLISAGVAAYVYFMASMNNKRAAWLIDENLLAGKTAILNECQKASREGIVHPHRFNFFTAWEQKKLDSVLTFCKKNHAISNKIRKSKRELLAFADSQIKELGLKITLDKVTNKIERTAQNMIPKRLVMGLPRHVARAPLNDRRPRVTGAAFALAWTDGKRNLLEIIRFAELDMQTTFNQSQMKDLVDYFEYLAKYGYLEIKYRKVRAK